MTLTHGSTCPHCDSGMSDHSPQVMPVAGAVHPPGWSVYLIICPTCRKSLGAYAAPNA